MIAKLLLLRLLHVVCNAEHPCSESGVSGAVVTLALSLILVRRPSKGSECGSSK